MSPADMSEHDKLPIRSQHPLARFDPRARREFVVRGLLALSEVRDADYFFFKGEEHMLRLETDTALSYYEKALQIDAEHQSSLYYHAFCILMFKQDHKELDKLIADFSKLIELNPHHAGAYYCRAMTYYRQGVYFGSRTFEDGFYDKAVSDYTKSIELKPEGIKYYQRGRAFEQGGKYDSAISDFSKATELMPRYARAYTSRATAYCSRGEYDKAISDFGKVIEIQPDDASAYISRAFTYYRKQDYRKAWQDVSKAEELGGRVGKEFLKALRDASGQGM